MFSKSTHKNLIKKGAPRLPPGYFYFPRVVFIDSSPFLRMEVRKSRWLSSVEVSRWTVDPDTYFNGVDNKENDDKVVMLCINAARQCDDLVLVEVGA